jgi:hypothetical protein
MIIALLFMILIAILFPKALRFLFALLFIGGIMILGKVHAATDEWATATVMAWKLAAAQCNRTIHFKGRACSRLASIESKLEGHGCTVNMAMWWCPLPKGEVISRECSHSEKDGKLMCPILPGERSP